MNLCTRHSTNESDTIQTLSVGGCIPLKIWPLLKQQIIQERLFYSSYEFKTKQRELKTIPEEDYDSRASKYMVYHIVDNHERKRYMNDRWIEMASMNGCFLLINKNINLFMIEPKEASDEVEQIITKELKDELVSVMIEDPIAGRISLYRWLYKILKELQ